MRESAALGDEGGAPAFVLELRRWNDDPAAPAVLAVDLSAGEDRGRVAWSGEVTFPAHGAWRATLRTAGLEEGVGVIAVDPATDGLVARPGLPATALPGEQVVVTLTGEERARWPAADATGSAWLAGPERAVFVQSREGAAWVVAGDPATGEVVPLFEAGDAPVSIVGSPAGNAVAVFNARPPHALRVYSAADGAVRDVDTDRARSPVVSWSPDGEMLIVIDSWARLLRGDGRLISAHQLSYDGGGIVLWSPTGGFALLRMWNDTVYRVEAGGSDSVLVFDRRGQLRVEDVAIAHDGSRVAMLYMNEAEQVRRIAVVPSDATRYDETLASHVIADFPFDDFQGWLQSMAWSPDGRSLAFTSGALVSDGGQRLRSALVVMDAASGAVREVRSDSESYYLWAVSWTADGRAIFAGRSSCYACDGGAAGFDLVDAASGRLIGSVDGGYPIAVAGDARILTAGQLVVFDRSGGARTLIGGAPDSLEVRGVVILPGGLMVAAVGPGRGALLAVDPHASGARPSVLGAVDWTVEPVGLLDDHTMLGMREGLARYDLATGKATPLPGASDGLVSLAPNRTRAVVLDRGAPATARVITLPSGEVAVLPLRLELGPRGAAPAWTADAARLAFLDGPELIAVDLAPHATVTRIDLAAAGLPPDVGGDGDGAVRVLAAAWADAGHVDVAVSDGIWRVAVDGGGAATRIASPPDTGFYGAPVLTRSPDGETLVVVSSFGAYALDEASGNWRELARVGASEWWGPSWGVRIVWAPDSSALTYAARSVNGAEDFGIVTAPIDGSGAYRLIAPPASRLVWPLAWLDDGRVVYAAFVQGI